MNNNQKLHEGGGFGHMNHLYENPDLTFGEIKDILQQASDGRLQGTIKVDGQNLYLSYSVKAAEPRFARTENEMLTGGLPEEGLSTRFPEAVLGSFTEAFNDWQKALDGIEVEEKLALFGEDANNFYNVEVTGYKINVIGYKGKSLVIQQVGHKTNSKLDVDEKGKKSPTLLDISQDLIKQASKKLSAALEQAQPDKKIVYNKTITLGSMADKKVLQTALNKIDQALQSVGLSDSSTVYEYTYKRIADVLNSVDLGLEEEAKDTLVRRIIGEKHLTIDKRQFRKLIAQSEDPSVAQNLEVVFRDQNKIKSEAIKPIERAIYDFSIEALSNLESFFVEDGSEQAKLLSKELEDAIQTLQQAGGAHRLDVLAKEVERLGPQGAAAMKTAEEGFVFSYNDITYKFTGAFAPLNQILGMTRFPRGGIQPVPLLPQAQAEKEFFYGDKDIAEPYPMTEVVEAEPSEEEMSEDGVIILYPGGFKPPHAGHFELAKRYAEQPDINKVIMLLGPSKRTSEDGSIIITKEDSNHIINEFYKQHLGNNIIIEEMPLGEENPMRAAFKWIEMSPPGKKKKTYALAASSKDTGRAEMFRDGHCHPDGKYCKENVDVIIHPVETEAVVYEGRTDEKNGKAISASTMREDLAAGDKENFKTNLPDEAKDHVDEIFDYLRGTHEEEVVEPQEPSDEEPIEEMSAMGAGAIAGFAGPPGKRNKKRTNYKKRSKKKKMTEEQILRKHIRKAIKNKFEQSTLKENKLRGYIRKIIQEAKIEDSPTKSTGINKLVGVLKVILPTIERAYKSLTTDLNQRESFKKHLLKAFIDTLSPIDALATIDAGAEEEPAPEEGLALTEQEADPAMRNIDENPKGINIDVATEKEPTVGTDVLADREATDKEEKEANAADALLAKETAKSDIETIAGEKVPYPAIPGLDETGRDESVDTYKKTVDAIIRTYKRLHHSQDKLHFKDYLVTNMLLYFDKWESDISSELGDITTPEYQTAAAEKEKYAGGAPEEAAPTGGEELAIAESIKKAVLKTLNI